MVEIAPRALWLGVLVTMAATGCTHAARGGGVAQERIRFVDGRAGRLRVSDGGTGGPAVVFVHGLGSDLDAWREQLDRIRPSRRAVAYDQRGHGGSDRARDGVYTVEALADDLGAVVDALGLRRFYLVGHSLSGTVLTAYAGAHPDRIAGLVYVDAVGDFRAVPPQLIARAEEEDAALSRGGTARLREAFAEMLGPAARPATRERVLASVARLDPPAFAALRRSMFSFAIGERLASYPGPILAVEAGGEPDPVRVSSVLPSVRRETIPGVSHWLQMDDPDAFARALDPFIGLSARRGPRPVHDPALPAGAREGQMAGGRRAFRSRRPLGAVRPRMTRSSYLAVSGPLAASSARSWLFRILPTGFRGMAATTSSRSGSL